MQHLLSSIISILLQFFNDCLILGKETDSDMERHIYDLILELNRISKSILLSVLPQLEFKLKVSFPNLILLYPPSYIGVLFYFIY